MKKILIATDFSVTSNHAIRYGLLLACYSKADILLFHVFSLPLPMVIEGTAVSLDALYDTAKAESDSKLAYTRSSMEKMAAAGFNQFDFLPSITTVSMIGEPKSALKSFCEQADVDMLLMGIKPEDNMVFGRSKGIVRRLIKSLSVPMLLIPQHWEIRPPRRIIFASDFSKGEILPIGLASEIAGIFKADFIVFHYSFGQTNPNAERKFFNQVAAAVDYPKIYYHQGGEGNLEQSLEKIEREQQADMLVMVHRKHNLLGELMGMDHTLKMIGRAHVPLLVFF